jgi:pyroglutamyl-peptidase
MKKTITSPRSSAVLPIVLLTGFDAFGGDVVNPSWLAVQALHGHVLEGHLVQAALLPTTFAGSQQALTALLRQYKPTLVLCVGLAGGRSAVCLERIAINVQDARIADNAGLQPIDIAVVKGGPAAYFSTLPIKAMRLAIDAAGVAAEVSQTAGTFVCNHVFYVLMHALKKRRSLAGTRGGFVHIPYLPGQGTPSMPIDSVIAGLRAAVACALVTPVDAVDGTGTLN